MGTAGGDEEKKPPGPKGNGVVSHPEPALALEDHVTLVPVVGLLGVGADRGE